MGASFAMARRLLYHLTLLSLCAYTSRASECVEFLSHPQSVAVTDGSSVSFSCVVANESIDHWYINNKTVGSYLQSDNYVLWEGCTRSRGYCGGTLFIKHANMELNEIVVCCQALHETCSGRKATLSESATLFVKSPDHKETIHLPVSSSAITSPSPSPSPSSPSSFPSPSISPATKSSVFIDYPLKTDVETMHVLVQRIPLIGAAAGICFILGGMFGAMCAVTIARGTKQCKKQKRKRRIARAVRVQPDPTYTELTATNSSGVRRSNEYIELDTVESGQPQSSSPNEVAQYTADPSCNGVTMMTSCGETVCMPTDGVPVSCGDVSPGITPPPLPDRQPTPQCSCIEVDLDELERAIVQQD